jgi:hypothetical protein
MLFFMYMCGAKYVAKYVAKENRVKLSHVHVALGTCKIGLKVVRNAILCSMFTMFYRCCFFAKIRNHCIV